MKSVVLTGGGARGAYQVGVLKAISDQFPGIEQPFNIVCGISAGALNAAGLAEGSSLFRHSVTKLEQLWSNISSEQVYRTDLWGMTKRFGQFTRTLLSGESDPSHPISLLDNTPLRGFLTKNLDFDKIHQNIKTGRINALCVTSCGYRSGQSVNFFESSGEVNGWNLGQRIGCKTTLTHEHLMASAAIPMVFPPVKINREYFGDGVLRLMAPLSPAIHLGSKKILVIGVSANRRIQPPRFQATGYPSLSNILEHMLNGAFIDIVEHDLERAQTINDLVKKIPENERNTSDEEMAPLDILEISPSKPVNEIAQRHLSSLPKNIQRLVGTNSSEQVSSSSLASYLMFEKDFAEELIALGYHDAQQKSDELEAYFL